MLSDGVRIGDILDSTPSFVIRNNPHLAEIWLSFFELSRTRPQVSTMSYPIAAPLTYSDISSYCKLYAIEDSGTLTEHLIRMDKEFVPRLNKKMAEAYKREQAISAKPRR